MGNCYLGQFTMRSDPRPDDGRVELLAELRKLRPQRPDSLTKRAGPQDIDDAAILAMTRTTEDERVRSNADAATQAVAKCLAAPSGHGLLMPETIAKAQPRRRLFKTRDIETMLARWDNLRKDSRTPPAVREMPGQSSNAVESFPPASRVGAVDTVADVDPMWRDTQPTKVPPPHSASITGRRAGPEDSDIEKPLQAEPDSEADLAADRSGSLGQTWRSVEAVRRDLHPSRARRML
jgi:hypothetical protein